MKRKYTKILLHIRKDAASDITLGIKQTTWDWRLSRLTVQLFYRKVGGLTLFILKITEYLTALKIGCIVLQV